MTPLTKTKKNNITVPLFDFDHLKFLAKYENGTLHSILIPVCSCLLWLTWFSYAAHNSCTYGYLKHVFVCIIHNILCSYLKHEE